MVGSLHQTSCVA